MLSSGIHKRPGRVQPSSSETEQNVDSGLVIGWVYGKDEYFRGLYDMFGHKLDVR